MVSTASTELSSIFRNYTIHFDNKNFQKIVDDVDCALRRRPEVFLDLIFDTDKAKLSSSDMKDILIKYQMNIKSLNIPIDPKDPEILLHPELECINLSRIDVDFDGFICDTTLCKTIFEAILARYAIMLKHLGAQNLYLPDNPDLKVPHMPKLFSLSLSPIDNITITFVNALRKENITHLELLYFNETAYDELIFPNLQDLTVAVGHIWRMVYLYYGSTCNQEKQG